MNLADLAGPGRTPACWDKPHLFSASALDYDPRDEAHAHLDLLGHTLLAARKVAAEEAAVDVCFGCPLMLACEKIDEENTARGEYIIGVVGGRTEAERKARRSGRTPAAAKTVSVPNPQIAPGDRGPRNQVDDDLVASLTKAGKTSDQIAHTLGCSARTVSRARKRMGLSAKPLAPSHGLTMADGSTGTPVYRRTETAVVPAPRTVAAAAEITDRTGTPATLVATHTGTQPTRTGRARRTITATEPTGNPFIGGRPVSPAMEAVYNHLATVGGSATLEDLLAVGTPQVDPAEALDWWVQRNSTTVNGHKVLRPAKAATPAADRIREGARSKVFNAIDATYRKGRYLDRDGETYTFKGHALTAWTQRMAEQAARLSLTA